LDKNKTEFMPKKNTGKIMWHDLTVGDAVEISDFYHQVTGWEKEGLSMGEYDDFLIKSPGDAEVVAGICHARGVNKDIPAQWLMYITVENLDESLEICKKLGGKVWGSKRKMGEGYYCLVQDPAGAYVMLCE
jgi:predicted enzyme related to lactoylglutathione lyase